MTITSPLTYRNGNCTVTIHPDGTKVRTVDDEQSSSPRWPESVDLKITDYCDAGCPWCHERSTVRGKHAEADNVSAITGGMVRGSEVAIGGGNPLDFPDVETLALNIANGGLIVNVTVNARHLRSHSGVLANLRRYSRISGLGISYDAAHHREVVNSLDDNSVVHLIAGVDTPESLARLASDGARKFLLLGYKDFGRGIGHRKNLNPSASVQRWRYFLPSILGRSGVIVSFDNLGLEQCGVREIIGERTWASSFMGDDGAFTMYVDAVRMEYAASSTSERFAIGRLGIREMFAAVRHRAGFAGSSGRSFLSDCNPGDEAR